MLKLYTIQNGHNRPPTEEKNRVRYSRFSPLCLEERAARRGEKMAIRHRIRSASGTEVEVQTTPPRAIKLFCRECMGHQVAEVPRCTDTFCPLFPYAWEGRTEGAKEIPRNCPPGGAMRLKIGCSKGRLGKRLSAGVRTGALVPRRLSELRFMLGCFRLKRSARSISGRLRVLVGGKSKAFKMV